MQRATTPITIGPTLHVLLRTGLTGPQFQDLKSRTESLMNDAYKSVHGRWIGYEIKLCPALDGYNTLGFILLDDDKKVDHIDKGRIPTLGELIKGGDSVNIMVEAVRMQHHYGLRYAGNLSFMDTKSGLTFRLIAHPMHSLRT
ncbi:MAG: hypothetical protein KGH94_03585 [Candidatus Micrarchaeota archaeon]|nr:hypothetical protein [Candidatus Micrarchaeota archaeon]